MQDDAQLEFETLSVADRLAAEALIVDVEGYEGPLDLLLSLSRTQKVDLRKVSILELARQYLGFVEKAKELRQRHMLTNWIAGVLMAMPLSVPLVNLLIPIIGAATFTHIFHRRERR